ncbi:MAG TPA: hypothetical protein VH023_22825 [Rhodopila sp.]|jgi:hypothetical protein|nr:hypothetical protein [Rhodopila sp.]
MDDEPALAMTAARCCRWVNIKGDWYKAQANTACRIYPSLTLAGRNIPVPSDILTDNQSRLLKADEWDADG